MPNKKAEFATLQALKQCRAEMVQDFLDYHNPEIYEPSYKYENSPVLLKLAREKYFMVWLSSHWHIFSHIVTQFPIEERRIAETIFARVFLELLGKWSIVKTTDSTQLDLGIKLVKDMENSLNQFMKVGENADTMRNKIKVALEKNRVVFDRMMKQLSEGEL
ncbi:MAG: hypothetical protein Q8Q54_04335 [Methylococcales bacterium]|nr:hypothetical protein [Methylococcales bacterium]MDP3838130.1 hypothetical protein [Methylococcales bacterium]